MHHIIKPILQSDLSFFDFENVFLQKGWKPRQKYDNPLLCFDSSPMNGLFLNARGQNVGFLWYFFQINFRWGRGTSSGAGIWKKFSKGTSFLGGLGIFGRKNISLVEMNNVIVNLVIFAKKLR